MLGLGLGVILASAYEYAIADYTFSITNEQVYSNNGFAGACAALSVAATICLFGEALIATMQRLCTRITLMGTGRHLPPFGYQLNPRLYGALVATGTIANLCALGPNYVIWNDFYPEKPYLSITLISALFFLLQTSTLDLIGDCVAASIRTAEGKAILRARNTLRALRDLPAQLPLDECTAELTQLLDSQLETLA